MDKTLAWFQRHEKKYRVNRQQYEQLMALIGDQLREDKYHGYKICNLYFDTPDYRLIQASIEKPAYKEKLRLRSYGVPAAGDKTFLEIKKKYKGVVYKRRMAMTYQEAIAASVMNRQIPRETQTAKEIQRMIDRYDLLPMVYLSYDRSAWVGADDKNLRITFDTNLVWRTTQLDLTAGDFGSVQLPEGEYIMEIKTLGGMPLWLVKALSQLKIYPTSYSKYGTIYQEAIMQERRAISC